MDEFVVGFFFFVSGAVGGVAGGVRTVVLLLVLVGEVGILYFLSTSFTAVDQDHPVVRLDGAELFHSFRYEARRDYA